jgi:biotin synthase
MKLFDILGITPKAPFVDGDQPVTNNNYKKCLSTKGNIKWSRPTHTIERNEKAKEKAKALRS